jgi:UPF0755 protein
MSVYLRRILIATVLIGVILGLVLVYRIYRIIFSPNTNFNTKEVFVYIKTGSTFNEVKEQLSPLLKNSTSFEIVAQKKGYTEQIRAGKYAILRGMSANEIVNTLRSGNLPVNVSFNNQESIEKLAGRIARQIEADSISLLQVFKEPSFLAENNFNEDTLLAMYIPNTYQFFWNTSAGEFRERMLKEYRKFWNEARLAKAESLQLTATQVAALAAIVQKETAKVEERPRIAGVYLNRLKDDMLLQADPTVIYAIKKHTENFDTIIKRVLYKDLTIDSPYNTYKYGGLPPGPITMPDITSLNAVLNAEQHDYYYFVADVTHFGYHKFAKTLAQHNENKIAYIKWLNQQEINR